MLFGKAEWQREQDRDTWIPSICWFISQILATSKVGSMRILELSVGLPHMRQGSKETASASPQSVR